MPSHWLAIGLAFAALAAVPPPASPESTTPAPTWQAGSLLPAPLLWRDWRACVIRVVPGVNESALQSQYAVYEAAFWKADEAARTKLRTIDAAAIRRDILQGKLDPDDPAIAAIDRVFLRLDAKESRLRDALHAALVELLHAGTQLEIECSPEDCVATISRAWRRRVIINQQPPGTIDWSRLPDLDTLAVTVGSPYHRVLTSPEMTEASTAVWRDWDLGSGPITQDVFRGWSRLLRTAWTTAAQGRPHATRFVGRAELRLWMLARQTVSALAAVAAAHGDAALGRAVEEDFRRRACPRAWEMLDFDRRLSALANGTFPNDVAEELAAIEAAWRAASETLRSRADELAWWDRTILMAARWASTPPDRWHEINQRFVAAMIAAADAVQDVIALDLLPDRDAIKPEIDGPARPPMSVQANRRHMPDGGQQVQAAAQSYADLYERSVTDAKESPQ